VAVLQRLALIGDVHGNRPALEAVLAEIDRRGIRHIIGLGDLAGKGPSGAAVVDLCRERCAVNLLGNWDAALARRLGDATFTWYQQELGPDRLAWLGSRPFAHDLVVSGQRVRLVHASPQGVNHRVHQHGAWEPMRAMFEPTELTDPSFVPQVVGYADIHTPFVRTFHQQTLFNVGSVGNPLDTTLAAFVVLEGVVDDPAPAPWGLEIVRVPYDIDRAIADAVTAGSPQQEAWRFELTTAIYRGQMPDQER
jgi:protein phosphatase